MGSVDLEDDILQDFLVEAGELLEGLNEQLVELERSPDDVDLLNAVFRAFHTVKGGAGFVNLTHMVTLCHRAEDVFNQLRNHAREVDAELMDAVLKALDVLHQMFDDVRGGEEPGPADAELIATLERLADPNAAPAAPEPAAPEPVAKPEAVAEPTPAPEPANEALAQAAGSGDITDEEFEALLDQLHGEGKHAGPPAQAEAPAAAAASGDGGDITDDEFEALLDHLHGQGQSPAADASAPAAKAAPEPQAPVEAAPAARPDPEPAAAAEKPAPRSAPAPKAAPAAKPTAKAAPDAAAHAPHPPAEATVRVDTKRLDDLMNLVGELVLVRNRMATLQSSMGDDAVSKTVSNLDQVTSDIQAAVMKTRMQPIKKVFGRFPRVVRDLARNLKKEVELELVGEETDLDKNLVEALADPLVHLVRNAVDHGIEDPDERVRKKKARAGRVVLSAKQAGDHILISIEDDGKGMDPEILRAKAVEKGMMTSEQAARLSDNEAFNLILAPGFSTKTEISDVSGRGVGMDVVKTRIAQLNGSVDIHSAPGRGSTLSIRLPLTLAILPTLMIVLGDQRFAIPLSSVCETYDLDLSRTNVVDDQEVLIVRNKPLPLFYLRRWLQRGGEARKRATEHVVVVQVASQRVCFVVDELLGQEEVVIKPLGAFLHGLAGFAGATITGDGRIALILDVPGLLRAYGQNPARAA
jgi:two-component system chemotaxis sensor kinase CheA